jgi:hypothetical protein
LRALRTFVSPFTGIVHGVDETLVRLTSTV